MSEIKDTNGQLLFVDNNDRPRVVVDSSGRVSSGRFDSDIAWVSMAKALGFVAATDDPRSLLVQHSASSGVLHGNVVWLQKGDIVRSIGTYFSVVDAGLTLSRVALYDSNLNLVGASASDPTFGQTLGYASRPLTSPYTVPASGWYYLADLYVGATTLDYLTNGQVAAAGVSQLPTPGNAFMYFQQAGLADLPSVAVPTTSSVPHFQYAI